MIIETLQDQQSTQEEKNEILNPYQEYLKTQSELIEEGKERQFYVEGDESSMGSEGTTSCNGRRATKK